LLTLLSVLVLAVAMLSPVGGAGAADSDLTFGGAQKHQVQESTTGSYVVIMAAAPLVGTYDRSELNSAGARADRARIRESHRQVMRDAGVSEADKVVELTNVVNGFSAIISHEEAQALAAQPDVALVMPDVMRQPTTDSSPDFLGLTAPGGAYDTGLDGSGVVVGVIDSGIWPEHPSFADDGSFPEADVAPGIPCEFGNTAHNPDDAAFQCNNKLLGARQVLPTYRALIGAEDFEFDSARDDIGHGTHTASTAAGNADVAATVFGRPRGTVNGIAYRAHVIAYKGLGALGGFGSDLALAIDTAVADGVDVINYSIGGGASLTGPDDLAFLFAADAGVFVATSAGNSGNGFSTIGGPANLPWVTTVAASTQSRFFPGRVVLGNGQSFLGASITRPLGNRPLVDAADAGGDLCLLGTLDPAVVEGAIVLCRRGTNARVEKSQAVLEAGGVGMIMYENTDDNNLFTDNHAVPTVHVDNTPGLAIKDYIADTASPTARLRVPLTTTTWGPAPSITLFSSRGPVPTGFGEDVIKPDITAPGIQILAGNSPYADNGQLFQAIAGTSMSSPHIAGVYALLKQAHPDWSPAAARSALMTTARHDVVDNDRVTPADPFATGSGHVNPGLPGAAGSMFQPGLVYDAGFNDYLGFLCGTAPEVFADPAATCPALEAAGFSNDPSNLNYPSIGVAQLAGSQTVTRTVTNVGPRATYRSSVDAPPGYDVTVRPRKFTLNTGGTQRIRVTITNDGSAPIGEWSFGSYTLTSGSYSVYSPIAANASLLGFPLELSGEGTDGSASFDVSFGYDGDYTAAGHGLEAAAITSDVVVQDPDQTFDPDDGFSNAHEFDLTGAAVFRLALPPDSTEADADLDVYVVGPNGEEVASSTASGTNELVTIHDPEPGVYTVWVHGWQTVGADADYDMSTWTISATPGGNLSIDSAPTEAVLGTVGTVDISWAGAEAAWNLGVVSHSDADGVIGYTLVEVDAR
jgi:subtilisin family serine protease